MLAKSLPLSLIASGLLVALSSCSHFPSQLRPAKNQAEETIATTDTHAPLVWTEEDEFFCKVNEQDWLDYPETAPLTIWDRVRLGYALPASGDQRVEQEIRWYSRHPDYMQRVTKRGAPFIYHIVEELEARGMPLELALLPIVESAFDPFAYSHGRASGMWQIIPGTGKMLGLKQNWWYDGRRDIVASTNAALNYLESLHKRFDGDWLLAVAAYNSGAGNVSKAIRRNKRAGKPTDFWHLRLPRETMAYVPRLIALRQLFLEPEQYSLNLEPVANTPFFERVNIEAQIDLARAAELANLDMETLYKLNPAFNRWATDPKGPHHLLIPLTHVSEFKENLALLSPDERVVWDRYRIRNGDTLSTIAKRYNISVGSLKQINKLRSHRIRAGRTLMVPVAAQNSAHYSHSSEERLNKRIASSAKKEKGNRIDYVVRRGDSLWSIGQQYGVSSGKIAKWNNMAPRDTIKPGQILALWVNSGASSRSQQPRFEIASNVGTALPNNGVIRKLHYKVRRGDSLHRIADKFGLRVRDIVAWNPAASAKYLQPGQALTLYVDVTR